MKELKELIYSAVILIISLLIKGFVFCKLYMWFIIPIFNFRNINLYESIGVIILIKHLFTKNSTNENDVSLKGYYTIIRSVLLSSLLSLLIGYIVKSFI